jgi:hypothetical protein
MPEASKKYALRPEYADVGDAGYLDRWIARRRDAARNIGSIVRIGSNGAAIRPAGARYFVLEIVDAILAEAARGSVSAESVGLVAALQKKFEVFQQVLTGYDSDFRKCADAVEIGGDQYVCLARLLLVCYQQTGSATYLSTSLKIVDYLLLAPGPEIRETAVGMLEQVIDRQLTVIGELQGS